MSTFHFYVRSLECKPNEQRSNPLPHSIILIGSWRDPYNSLVFHPLYTANHPGWTTHCSNSLRKTKWLHQSASNFVATLPETNSKSNWKMGDDPLRRGADAVTTVGLLFRSRTCCTKQTTNSSWKSLNDSHFFQLDHFSKLRPKKLATFFDTGDLFWKKKSSFFVGGEMNPYFDPKKTSCFMNGWLNYQLVPG